MKKKCKSCWRKRDHSNMLTSLCIKCYYLKQREKQNTEKEKTVEWRIALFSIDTKKEIYNRDKTCIICQLQITDYHHVYFWWQAEYTEDRNTKKKWVWLCRQCHHNIHNWIRWDNKRDYCINYLNKIYG